MGKKKSFECLWSGQNCRLRLEIIFMMSGLLMVVWLTTIWTHKDASSQVIQWEQLGISWLVGFSLEVAALITRCDGVCVWSVLRSIPVLLIESPLLWAQGNVIYTRWDDSMGRANKSVAGNLSWTLWFELRCSWLLWLLAILQQKSLFPSLFLVKHFILCQGRELLKCTRFSTPSFRVLFFLINFKFNFQVLFVK